MHHDPLSLFAVLALIVAVLGAWTALDLFNRARSHLGSARLRWLLAGIVEATGKARKSRPAAHRVDDATGPQ